MTTLLRTSLELSKRDAIERFDEPPAEELAFGESRRRRLLRQQQQQHEDDKF